MKNRKWPQADVDKVMKWREQGLTLEAIGLHYGVTKERIRLVEAKETRRRYEQSQRESVANVLDLEVQYLDAPIRVINCLSYAEVKTVRDLLPLKDYHLLRLNNFGRKSVKDLTSALASLGVTWPTK